MAVSGIISGSDVMSPFPKREVHSSNSADSAVSKICNNSIFFFRLKFARHIHQWMESFQIFLYFLTMLTCYGWCSQHFTFVLRIFCSSSLIFVKFFDSYSKIIIKKLKIVCRVGFMVTEVTTFYQTWKRETLTNCYVKYSYLLFFNYIYKGKKNTKFSIFF